MSIRRPAAAGAAALGAAMMAMLAGCAPAPPDARPEKGAEPAPAVAAAVEQPFRMEPDGDVFIPGWDDDRSTTGPEELGGVHADEFPKPAFVYRHEVIISRDPADAPAVDVPEGAAGVVVVARGVPWTNVFPRMRVTATPADGGAPVALFEGIVQSLTHTRLAAPLPPSLRGARGVVLRFELLNPETGDWRRQIYLRRVAFTE